MNLFLIENKQHDVMIKSFTQEDLNETELFL